MANKRYIHIDSTYRNRKLFPYPAQFVIPINYGSNTVSLTALDPVLNSYPFYEFTGNSVARGPEVFNGGTFVNPILNIAASNVDDFYNGYRITNITLGQTRLIIGYVGSSQTLTLDHPFSNTWAAGNTYTIQDPSTSSVIQMQPGAASSDNYYVNNILEDETIGQFRTITAYDGGTRTATLSSPFIGWALANTYSVRNGIPLEQGQLQAGSTLTTAVLPLTSSSQDEYYTGYYIHIRTGAASGNVLRIASYDGATRTATVSGAFTAVPAALSVYEILQFSRDNFVPLNYTGSLTSQQETVCYEIELIELYLPNVPILTGNGDRITFYPYVYVEFSNETALGYGKNIIYSNNPNASKVLFVAPIDDLPIPSNSNFVRITGSGMVQTVKFKPNDTLKFSVTLPNGELFITEADNFSPLAPNPSLQVQATFSIRRVE